MVNRKLVVETLRVKTKSNNNYDIHKTQSLLQIIILKLNKIKKYWRWQNIGANKILAPTKYWRRQNTFVDKIIGIDKILALTKYWRRQNIGIDKIQASTKSWRPQNLGVDKKLAQTKRWPRRKIIPLLFGSEESSCWLLPGPAEDLLCLPDGVALFACSRQVWRCLQPPCFNGRNLSHTVPAYCTGPPCSKPHKFWRDKISVSA